MRKRHVDQRAAGGVRVIKGGVGDCACSECYNLCEERRLQLAHLPMKCRRPSSNRGTCNRVRREGIAHQKFNNAEDCGRDGEAAPVEMLQ